MQIIVHAPFGARINRAWGMALRKRICRSFDFELQASATDDGLNFSLGPEFLRSPPFRHSTLMTSAPISRNISDARGAACHRASSKIRTPSKTLPGWVWGISKLLPCCITGTQNRRRANRAYPNRVYKIITWILRASMAWGKVRLGAAEKRRRGRR